MLQTASKAKTLKLLESRVILFKVPGLEVFDTEFFSATPDEIVSQIKNIFAGTTRSYPIICCR